MKSNHGIVSLAAIFAVVLIGLAILSGAGRMMVIYKQSASQKSIMRGVESIDAATQAITDDFAFILDSASQNKYKAFCELVKKSGDSPLKERDIENYFKIGVLSEFSDRAGEGDGLYEHICKIIEPVTEGRIELDSENKPYMYVDKTEDGMILSASVKNVRLIYHGIPGIERRETVNFNFDFPEAIFYAGNEDIFEYCMMAEKGIYVTGATSSMVGNIYAGVHSATESRDLEVAYGEIGSYGGLNFLSTQVGIKADKVFSEGDINLNGSFVIFNPDRSSGVKCYADKIRKIRGYSSDSLYSITGDFFVGNELPEGEIQAYTQIKDDAKTTLSGIDEIPFYYDSNNDKEYTGSYRKIISSEDVEISEDITGIVFTPGNVIVDAGCNVEGLILSGDRIYAMGNNSIVSNASIVKSIVADEIEDNNKNTLKDEKIPENENDFVSSGIVYHALDYIGGLVYPGLTAPNYYVIPYQE